MKPATARSERRDVLVTGVSRGLGRALVTEFVERGHRIAGCSRSRAAIEELRRVFGDPHVFEAVDVADDDAVRRFASALLGKGFVPRLLVNNAGIINHNAPLWLVPASEFDAVIDVNVKGTASVIRHFLPAMIEAKTGVVANMSSGWGRSTSPEVAPYCASKFAIEGLTKALAKELPEGLVAVAMNPGVVDTDMLRICYGAGASSFEAPAEWSRRAVEVLLRIGPRDNGRSIEV